MAGTLRRSLGRVCLMMLAAQAGLGVASMADTAGPDRVVLAGAEHPTDPLRPYEYNRFYPEYLQIHPGQSVEWRFAGRRPTLGFHTVTIAAQRPSIWRLDERLGYALPEEVLLPTFVSHGAYALNGRLPPLPGSRAHYVFDVPVGIYDYFCSVHPTMEGTLEVVPDAKRIPSQAAIDAVVADQVERDTRAADRRWDAGRQPRSSIEDGRRVWRVWLGDATDDDHVTIASYLPPKLTIGSNDIVRFAHRPRTVGPIINGLHTATFPAEVATQGPWVGLYPACDPDDPATGLKGIPWTVGSRGQPCPFNNELLWQVRMTRSTPAPGNAVLTPATYHDSGVLVPPGAPERIRFLPDRTEPMPSTFAATFPVPGTFAFGCGIHERDMIGSITVAAP